jgi:hypothetical protein
MDWLLERFPLVIAIVVVIAKVLQGLFKSREAQAEHEQQHDETEEQRRVREIQERIRRAVAERRGRPGTEAPPALEPTAAPPVLRQETVMDEDGDPFHQPGGGVATVAEPRAAVQTRNLELERQAELAEKMRELEEARELARRRAATAAEMQATSAPTAGAVRRHRLNEVFHDRDALRRAVLLREVLGPPVGLR